MAIEAATYVSQLDPAHPTGAEAKSEGDDHLRLIKSTLVGTFPNLAGAVARTAAELNTVTDRALKAGDTYTGTHNFTGATANVATAAPGTSSNAAASTAFAQALLAGYAGNALGLVLTIDATTAVTLVAGMHVAITNAAAVTVTLPATPGLGATVAISPCNGRYDNVLARNGSRIMGLEEDMTIDTPGATMTLRYVDATNGWRLI